MSKLNNCSYRFGPVFMNVTEQLLLRDGVQVALTQKAFETLAVLVEHVGHLVE